ncbi:MAG: TetR/AcrR family transcriptional regulator [Mesorhizobium sp.]|uniref:TetR/AcrR family transcriptional regulator n=1 Tax=Mesorhizobium sp. TaxID=1871066 RepID=UPI0011F738AA|nr:TetR/AcrR family transcriptional regulator [Mesorhizobium sp.]TIT02524.1 MAG: TetR/AcrR family transcriptional regulator [Mesorhizobium sp.]TIT53144.1 MAG: TetR/AcrR family transcriptional regulator [Mesorhizobium sp.]
MNDKPKTRRRYDARLRLARASGTRQRILDVAKKLFTARGVEKVTISDIASAAGVSAPTLYALFQSKTGILRAVVERSFFGPRYAEIAKQVENARDPEEILRITASISRVILDTEREEIGLMRGVSALSPELKAIETELEAVRFRLQEARAKLLVESVTVARQLGLARVRDILWMYTGRDVYRILVLERGWSSDEYESWLAETLIKALM